MDNGCKVACIIAFWAAMVYLGTHSFPYPGWALIAAVYLSYEVIIA
jgi:hypothetical protein